MFSPLWLSYTIPSFFFSRFFDNLLIPLVDFCSMTFPYNLSVTQDCISDISGFSYSFDSWPWFNVHSHTSAHTSSWPSKLQLPQNIHTCFSKLSSHACCHRLNAIIPSKASLLLHSISVESLLPDLEKVLFNSTLTLTAATSLQILPFSLLQRLLKSAPPSHSHSSILVEVPSYFSRSLLQ